MQRHGNAALPGGSARRSSWGVAGAACRPRTRAQLDAARQRMVTTAVIDAGVKNLRVIEAMRTTPRHEFVPRASRKLAYEDMALPIGDQQTISSPFIVAFMTEAVDPQPTDRVLEIGTGSGYQAAVLSGLVQEVYTIEIVESLGRTAQRTLEGLRYQNVHVKIGDGFQGWPEHAPFDKIIVTCSPESVPQPLIDQLREGGLIVIPVGPRYQQVLHLMRKRDGKLVTESQRATLFVPMTGTAEDSRKVQPDPLHPALHNSGFEAPPLEGDFIPDWYYQRQLSWVTDTAGPGRHALHHVPQRRAGQAGHRHAGISDRRPPGDAAGSLGLGQVRQCAARPRQRRDAGHGGDVLRRGAQAAGQPLPRSVSRHFAVARTARGIPRARRGPGGHLAARPVRRRGRIAFDDVRVQVRSVSRPHRVSASSLQCSARRLMVVLETAVGRIRWGQAAKRKSCCIQHFHATAHLPESEIPRNFLELRATIARLVRSTGFERQVGCLFNGGTQEMNRAMLRRVLMVGVMAIATLSVTATAERRLASLGWLLRLATAGPTWAGPATTGYYAGWGGWGVRLLRLRLVSAGVRAPRLHVLLHTVLHPCYRGLRSCWAASPIAGVRTTTVTTGVATVPAGRSRLLFDVR